MLPELLCIGHACHDIVPDGYVPGGAVTYAGLFAHKLGLRTAILTSFGADFQFTALFNGLQLKSIPAEKTTVFENQPIGEHRQQYLLAKASDLNSANLPQEWQHIPMIFLGPIADEVDFDFLDAFPHSLVVINPQGWMRQWDEKGKVFYKALPNISCLNKADALILSEEDILRNRNIIDDLREIVPILLVTKGALGCDIYFEQQKINLPAYQTKVIDTTGAGDVFSITFLIYYYKIRDIILAARYANVAASFCIEGKGITKLPDQKQLQDRFLIYSKRVTNKGPDFSLDE